MAQKDLTIDDILNGGNGSPGKGGNGTTAGDNGTTEGVGTQPVQPSTVITPPPVDRHLHGVADFGNGEDIKQKPVTTVEATDPTQAAVNLVEQRRKEQAQQRSSVPPVDRHLDGVADFMNYERAQKGQTPEKSPVFTDNVQTTATSPAATTGANGDGSNGNKEKDAAAVNTEAKETKDGKKKSPMSYADMFAAMEPYKEPTKEELEKERKKEKRERLFAALGDGISALSNLFFTTQYAPNMYNPKETNSERVDDYWTKLRDEREANRRRYVDGYLKAKQADDLHAIQQQNADVAAEWKKADTERKNAIAKAQGEVLAARAAKDQSAADLAAKKLEYLMAGWPEEQAKKQAEIDLLRARKKAADAQANNANASADEHRRRGTKAWVSSSGGKGGKGGSKGGSSGGYPWYDKNGGLHYAKQEGVAKQMAKQNGTYVDDYANNTSTDEFGTKKTSRTHSGWHSQKPVRRTQGGGKGGGKGRFSGFSIHKKK